MTPAQALALTCYIAAGILTFIRLAKPCRGRTDMIVIAFILSCFWFVMVADILSGEIPKE